MSKPFRNQKTIFVLFAGILIIATFIGAIWWMFLSVGRHIGLTDPPKASEAIHIEKVNLSKEYSFSSVSSHDDVDDAAGLGGRLTAKAEGFKDLVNNVFVEQHPFAPHYYYLFGITNRLLGRNVIENSEKNVLRLSDGKLVFADHFESAPSANNRIADFAKWLHNRSTDFLYVLPASKSDDSLIDYPKGFETEFFKNYSAFTSFLQEQEISCLDAREMLLATNKDFYSYFYNTDHHWNVQAGLLTATEITERLANEFSYPVNCSIIDESNFESVIYPKAMLGSIGRKTTLGYTDAEDMEVLYPKFETDFYVTHPESGIAYDGEMRGNLIFPQLIGKGYYSGGTAYSAFTGDDISLVRIKNRKCDNDVHALVLKESKANIVNPYLACTVEYLDIIDPRYFHGSIRTFIEKTNPDIVLIISLGPSSDEDTTWELK